MPDFRRGAAAIAESQAKAKSGGGSFRPFTPSLFWKDDGDEKYLLFLNQLDDIPTVDMIGYIPVERKKGDGETFTYFEQVIARTSDVIGEDSDPMVDDWDGNPKDTCVAVAVELEPSFETVKGRKRPVGFEVKTNTYERRVRDDEGELTDETEEVTTPVLGFVTQSPHNFFNVVTSFDANDAPIDQCAVKITRVGSKTDTTYTIQGYPEQEVDLGGLLDYVDGISYLGDDLDDVIEQIDGLEDGDAALLVGTVLLDKRLDELCDRDRYDELYKGLKKTLDPWKNKGKGGKGKASARKDRPARRSQRRTQVENDAADAAEETQGQGGDRSEEPEETPEPKAKPARKRAAPKADSGDAKASKLDELRARQAARKAKVAA